MPLLSENSIFFRNQAFAREVLNRLKSLSYLVPFPAGRFMTSGGGRGPFRGVPIGVALVLTSGLFAGVGFGVGLATGDVDGDADGLGDGVGLGLGFGVGDGDFMFAFRFVGRL